MGMCKPSGGVEIRIGRVGSLPRVWKPNGRIDLCDKNKKLLQQGWYGSDARIIWYRDWSHGGGEHEWPHDHYVDWANPKNPRPPYIGPNGEKTNPNFY